MTPATPTPAPKSAIDRFLGIVERAGNALPHPATLFALFALAVLLLSWVCAQLGLSAVHPATGKEVTVVNLLSVEGLHRILKSLVTNFTGFAPLGTVLVAMMGIGIAESSGLIGAALRALVLSAPRKLLTFVLVFAGIISNTASEVGYVLLVPLGGVIFLAVGRHPLAGIAATFAGVSGGYSANLFLGTVDPLLAGLSQEAARLVAPAYEVKAVCNYYFLFVSTFFLAIAGTFVTERIVIPRLGAYTGDAKPEELRTLTGEERKGLRYALVVGVLFVLVMLLGLIPESGFLRNPQDPSLLKSPVLDGVVALLFVGALAMGVAYGVGAGTIKNDAHVVKGMGKALETLGGYMVLVFFAAQFVAFFSWTNLGLIFAVKGAEGLKSLGLPAIPLLLSLVLMTACVNLLMGSAAAKWAILAPVFVPMFMLLGFSPEVTQAAYRVGDSVTNVISPMMSYFALIVAFVARYVPGAGIGTVVATMLPYSVVFFFVWSALLIVWYALGLPVGPGAGLHYVPTAP
ncbi:MAG: AbgT family transporter [Planctomycetes bacterium]|nr:AbgT family transporter [Planctomycetota bacterium]